MKSKLALNTAWMTLGQGAYAACQWAMLIVLARFQGVELVGTYALALAITAPVMIFSQLQLRYVFITDVAGQYSFREYFLVRLATTALGTLFILAVTLFGGFERGVVAVILAVGIAKAFENLSDLYYGLAQRHERLDLVGISLALRASLGLAAFAVGLYLSGRLVVGVLAMGGAWALVFMAFDRRATARWRSSGPALAPARSDFQRATGLALLGLPLGVAVMLVALNTNIPNYFVAAHVGQRGLGALAAMAYFVSAGDLLVNAVGQAASARLATYFATGAVASFRRLLGFMLMVSLIVGSAGVLGALLLAAPILRLLYGADFIQYAELFVWIMLAGAVGFLAVPLGYALTAMRSFRIQPWILGSAIMVNIVACYFLVPSMGLAGAVWAWTGSRLCQVLFFFWAANRRLQSEQGAVSPSTS